MYKFIYNYGYNKDLVMYVNKKLNSIKETGYFKGKNNINIYYEKYCVKNEKGKIILCHGFSECLYKFNEIIYYFTKMGYSVFAIEHRGHGRSGCLSKTHKNQINIDKFQYYVEDLKIFLDKIVGKNNKNLYLYAHSMGGAIGTMFLQKYPNYFKKAILSAPMFEIKTANLPKWLAYIISFAYILIGKGDKYLFGHHPFYGKYNLEKSGSKNKYRYKTYLNIQRNNEEIQRCGGSFKWLFKSLIVSDKIIKKRNVKKINIPIIIFQAGKDTFVKARGQNKFYKRAKNCKIIRFKNAKHEFFGENDKIFIQYLKIINKFLD